MNTIVDSSVIVPWPTYTLRLDIEPELAMAYGNEQQPVAGQRRDTFTTTPIPPPAWWAEALMPLR